MDIYHLGVFMVLTTFSPGPNNISSAAMGIVYGYRKTLPYLLGITLGVFLVMGACAMLSSVLLALVPAAEPILKWVGSIYILWLALSMLRAGYGISDTDAEPRAFAKGMLLQLVNPKGLVYGMTVYSTFLAPLSGHMGLLVAFGAGFALVALASVSFWALCGAAVRNRVRRPGVRRVVNTLLCLMLVYTAAGLAGLV